VWPSPLGFSDRQAQLMPRIGLMVTQSAEDLRGRGAPSRHGVPSWYDVTWNPTAGCSPVGPGCAHCSALRAVVQLARMSGRSGARYTGLTTTGHDGAHWTGAIRVREDVMTWPLLQRRGRRILVDSLSDLFHENLETEAIDRVHAVAAAAPWHVFLVLTRRAERMRAYFSDPETPQRIAAQLDALAAAGLATPSPSRRASRASAGPAPLPAEAPTTDPAAQPPAAGTGSATPAAWPLPNLWLGVAVEVQQYAHRIAALLHTPAAHRWLCFEPLLGPVHPDAVPENGDAYIDALTGAHFRIDATGRRLALPGPPPQRIDWVMAGGETGSGARKPDLGWVRELRDRAVAARVPFFFKDWGEWAPAPINGAGYRMVRCGRRRAGRLIDGRSWDELPAALRDAARRRR
jgi:protein gp37